jgi:hypothetical protein
MAKQVLTNALIAFGGYNLRSSLNQVGIEHGSDAVPSDVFAQDTHVFTGGLKSAAISSAGFFDAEYPDRELFERIGSNVLYTVAPSITPGDPAYMLSALHHQYNPGAQIGQMFGFTLAAAAQDRLLRGTLMEYRAAVSANANGTGRQLGAVSALQSIYCGLHVTAAPGTTPQLTVIVESDDNGGFSTPTTRITMTAQGAGNAVGFELRSLAGPVTDDFWRLRWTVSGSGLGFDFIGSLAIQ